MAQKKNILKTKETRRRYTDEFKNEPVQMMLDGDDARNMRLMIQSITEYPQFQPIWQRAVAQLPWAHNIILIQKVKGLPTRLWYAQAAFENGWSRDVLSLQIDSHAHKRQGEAGMKKKATKRQAKATSRQSPQCWSRPSADQRRPDLRILRRPV